MKKNSNNKYSRCKIRTPRLVGAYRAFTFLILGFLLSITACSREDSAHEHDTYTCPMHPTVISDRPGTCPVCGMDLVRKTRPGEELKITEDLSKLLNSPNEVIVASTNTIKGEYKSMPVTVEAQGVVTYDTRNIFTIPARVAGRLENVSLKYTFQEVSKGQKIAEIYSPELITAQREFLFLLENDAQNESLISSAKNKLGLLGMSASQINELATRRQASNTIIVYSPYSGYLITGQQTPPTSTAARVPSDGSGGMAGGMGGNTNASTQGQAQMQATPTAVLVREGDYVSAGQTLFTIVNDRGLRIELNLPGRYSGTVKEGDKVELSFGGGHLEMATIDFIQPFFEEGQEFLKLRVYINQTEGLHIGHLVNAAVHLSEREALWVPKEAVLMLGVQKLVFIKERGVFKPKEVTTGISVNGLIEITNGLASSEEIAANAHFLVDSESFVKPVN